MRGRIWTLLLPFLSILAQAGVESRAIAEEVAQEASAESYPGSQRLGSAIEGLVVLQNGSVLHGAIHRVGGFYHIQMEKGSLRVAVGQVEMFCRSMDEAYQRRREMRTAGAADAHLELMRWCLRHQLYEQAARELLDARTIDPEHPSLAFLQRQLQQALQTSERNGSLQGTANSQPQIAQPDEASTAMPQISPALRAEFVRKIQPILVHSCTTAGCHAPNSPQRFQLNRHVLDGPGHPEATKRNLASTLAQSGSAGQDDSSLLSKSQQPHRGSQPLTARQTELLTAWIERVQAAEEPPAMDSPAREPTELAAEPGIEPEAIEQTEQGGTDKGFPDRPPRPNNIRLRGEPPRVRHGVQLQSFQPRDPFDAETFNRHYEHRLTTPVQPAGGVGS